MMVQSAGLLLFGALFGWVMHPHDVSVALFTLLALVAAHWYPVAGWSTLHAVHLTRGIRSVSFNTRDPVAMVRTLTTIAAYAYHSQCDYVQPDVYWLIARQRAVGALVFFIPSVRLRRYSELAAVVSTWVAISWFTWYRQLHPTTALYAVTLLPHSTYASVRAVTRKKKGE